MVLEKESFFSKNRMYLLGCLFLTFSLPFLTLPELVNNQGIVSATIEKHIEKEPITLPIPIENQIAEHPISNQKIKKEDSPSINNNTNTETSQGNAESIASTETPTLPASNITSEKKGVLYWLLMVYLFGVVIFSLNFISQIANVIIKIIKGHDRIEDTDCTIINSPQMTEPCSFFKYIFINPESYDYETYEQILAHERVHVKLNHTWDLILSELVVIVMWFNPFAWILRKEIEKNIEYQTDDYLLAEEKVEKETYQMNLLKVATYSHPLNVVTNYNQSLIKQRILRINAKKSNLHSYWKYAFVAPLLFGIALLLNRPNLGMAQSESIVPTIEDASITDSDELIKSSNEITQKDLASNNNISNNEISNSTIPDDNEDGLTDCEKLLKAAKKNNVNKVKQLLQTFNPSCLPYADKQDYLNLNFIKSFVDNGAKIYIDQDDKDITIEDLQVIFKGNENLELLNDNNQYGVLISRKKCSEVWKAAAAGNFKRFNQLFSQLERDCVVNGTGDDFALFEHFKKLAAQDVPLDIGTLSFVIKADELITNDNSPNSVLNLKRVTKFESNHSGDSESVTDSDKCLALLNAIQAGDLSLIIKLLETVDPNCAVKDSFKSGSTTITGLQTPLVYAARSGNIKIGELLIEADADVDYHVYSTESPVEVAIDNGNSNFVQLLIENGAASNQVTTRITIDENKKSNNFSSSDALAFIKAAQNGELEMVKYFIQEGVNINSVVPNMGTALSAAAQNGKLTTVKYLVTQGADLDIGIQNHGTALMRAAQNGKLKTVEYLLSQDADIDYIIQNIGNALTKAAQNGELRTVKYLLSKDMDINVSIKNVGTPLSKAAQNGELETVKYLISQGAKIDFITENIGSALFLAAQNGELETVKYLHSQGADLNLVIPNRGTAMSVAAQNGELATLKYLRKHGKKN